MPVFPFMKKITGESVTLAQPALTSPVGKICNGDLQSYFCRGPSSHSHTLFSQIRRMPAPLASVWKNTQKQG